MDWGNQGCSSYSQGIHDTIYSFFLSIFLCFPWKNLVFIQREFSKADQFHDSRDLLTWICCKEKKGIHHNIDIRWLYSAGNGIQWNHSTDSGYCAVHLPYGAACVSPEVLLVCWAYRHWQICLYHGQSHSVWAMIFAEHKAKFRHHSRLLDRYWAQYRSSSFVCPSNRPTSDCKILTPDFFCCREINK